MLATLLAQESTDLNLEAIFGGSFAIIMLALPFVIGLVTNGAAQEKLKKAIAVVLAIATGVLSIAFDDWSMLSVDLVMSKAAAGFVAAEAGYRLWDGIVSTVAGKSLSDVLVPNVGVGSPGDVAVV